MGVIQVQVCGQAFVDAAQNIANKADSDPAEDALATLKDLGLTLKVCGESLMDLGGGISTCVEQFVEMHNLQRTDSQQLSQQIATMREESEAAKIHTQELADQVAAMKKLSMDLDTRAAASKLDMSNVMARLQALQEANTQQTKRHESEAAQQKKALVVGEMPSSVNRAICLYVYPDVRAYRKGMTIRQLLHDEKKLLLLGDNLRRFKHLEKWILTEYFMTMLELAEAGDEFRTGRLQYAHPADQTFSATRAELVLWSEELYPSSQSASDLHINLLARFVGSSNTGTCVLDPTLISAATVTTAVGVFECS